MDFYPRSPCGERLDSSYGALAGATISIHALLAESDESAVDEVLINEISIHALLAESDFNTFAKKGQANNISIHALLAESDDTDNNSGRGNTIFLSTLSLRRATLIEFRELLHPSYFYPRSPCGERQTAKADRKGKRDFYPRSPCGERQKP